MRYSCYTCETAHIALDYSHLNHCILICILVCLFFYSCLLFSNKWSSTFTLGTIFGVVIILIMSITLTIVYYKKKSQDRGEFQPLLILQAFYFMNKTLWKNVYYLTLYPVISDKCGRSFPSASNVTQVRLIYLTHPHMPRTNTTYFNTRIYLSLDYRFWNIILGNL